MSFTVGSLVRARNREWVVLPGTDQDIAFLRPLGGLDHEITAIDRKLETVVSASFALPDTNQLGDYYSSRYLRDSLRLGFRSSAGPFRSFGHIAVEPRPYQLVPLLLALKLDPVRLLISDDVGIGKTVEALLILKELIDRGEVERFAILCPPHLAEQWQRELSEKFHIDAELVVPGRVAKLERNCKSTETIFDIYPYLIISIDYIKSSRHKDALLNNCPDLIIVDEAHSCASASGSKSQHYRYELLKAIAEKQDKNLILVTATPHSGKELAFRSLLTLLNKDFESLPLELTGIENEKHRRALAAHFIQRRRGDIKHYLDTDTVFPERETKEDHYHLSDEYKAVLETTIKYLRKNLNQSNISKFQMRVNWWSALALLRALASSPAAAEATLLTKTALLEIKTEQETEVDDLGKRLVLDQENEDGIENVDVIPGSINDTSSATHPLKELAIEVQKLKGEKDFKLAKAKELIKGLLKDGYRPIIFCRFIDTAEYVASELRKILPKDTQVMSITGILAPDERESRISELASHDKRVLVATDCLSEGINLQDHFDAVFHYDLSWNPTRHEQREGRVDRYGQEKEKVRVVTFYGVDNKIDGIVLDILLRKHKAIHSSLGISVPVPVDTNEVIEAIFEGLLLRDSSNNSGEQQVLSGMEEYLKPKKEQLFAEWDKSAEREKRSRTMFAQESIKTEDIAQRLKQVHDSVGYGSDIERFFIDVLRSYGASISGEKVYSIDVSGIPQGLKEILELDCAKFKVKFSLPVADDVIYISRTHPLIENLANYVLSTALDKLSDKKTAHRCGVIRTSSIEKRTTLLLVRLRYHIVMNKQGQEKPLLAEDVMLAGFTGSPHSPVWLSVEETEKLLSLKPSSNINPDQAKDFIQKVIDGRDALLPFLETQINTRATELLEEHKSVRSAAGIKGIRYNIKPNLPADILGIYVYLPAE